MNSTANHLKMFLFANNPDKKAHALSRRYHDESPTYIHTPSAHINSNPDSTKYNQQSNYNLALNFDFCVAELMKMWKWEKILRATMEWEFCIKRKFKLKTHWNRKKILLKKEWHCGSQLFGSTVCSMYECGCIFFLVHANQPKKAQMKPISQECERRENNRQRTRYCNGDLTICYL